MTVQVVVMDEKSFILEFKDFDVKDTKEVFQYILTKLRDYEVDKIHIRKWD